MGASVEQKADIDIQRRVRSSYKNGVDNGMYSLLLSRASGGRGSRQHPGNHLPSLDGYFARRGVYVKKNYNFDLVVKGRQHSFNFKHNSIGNMLFCGLAT